MKTLNEVIEKIEKMWVCPSSDEDAEYCDFMDVKDDALHYLRMFRDAKDALEAEKERYAEAVRNCERAENKYRKAEQDALKALDDWASRPVEENKKLVLTVDNPPLTYDELLQMGRKPVWIEWLGPRKRMSRWWIINHDANECPGKDTLLSICTSGTRQEFLMRDEEGKTWQAYRKERE